MFPNSTPQAYSHLASGSKIPLPSKIQTPLNLTLGKNKQLDPISKKNLINQLKAHLQKDPAINNVN